MLFNKKNRQNNVIKCEKVKNKIAITKNALIY